MDGIVADTAKALAGAGPVAMLLFYFLRQKQADLDRANTKVDTLQSQIVSMLQAQIESEPKRRETLDGLKRLVEDQSAMLKGKVVQ